LPPSCGMMKPNPFVALNHFTVPIAMGMDSCVQASAHVSACGATAGVVMADELKEATAGERRRKAQISCGNR
jgi:hypothetical protein